MLYRYKEGKCQCFGRSWTRLSESKLCTLISWVTLSNHLKFQFPVLLNASNNAKSNDLSALL